METIYILGNLNAHIKRVHRQPDDETIYPCSQCTCAFKKLGSLSIHVKKAHEIPIEVLKKVYNNNYNYISHKQLNPSIQVLFSILLSRTR